METRSQGFKKIYKIAKNYATADNKLFFEQHYIETVNQSKYLWDISILGTTY
jgi:hypothetical protein